MAYTLSHIANSAMGPMRVRNLRITADAATQAVETGLGNVFWAGITPISCTAVTTLSAGVKAGWSVYWNSNASGVKSAGVLGISNAVSGDYVDAIVFGWDK